MAEAGLLRQLELQSDPDARDDKIGDKAGPVFLLATPTAFTLHGDVGATAGRAIAIVVGVFVAALFFHAAHEEAPRRVHRLAREVVREEVVPSPQAAVSETTPTSPGSTCHGAAPR